MMKLCAIGIVLVLGCGRSDDKAGQANPAAKEAAKDDGKADLDALAKIKDELCACKDKACGNAVADKLSAKTKEMDATYASSHNKSILHYAMETEMAARKCLSDLK